MDNENYFKILKSIDDRFVFIDCEIKEENVVDGLQLFASLGYFNNTVDEDIVYVFDIDSDTSYCLIIPDSFNVVTSALMEDVVFDILNI